MKTLREYVEEKECEQLEEGVITTAFGWIGKILGFGATGVMYAWLVALILKGGKGAVENIAKTLNKTDAIKFRAAIKEAKKSPAVQEQLNKQEKIIKTLKDEYPELAQAIQIKDWETAHNKYMELPLQKRNSSEVKQFIIDEITRVCGMVISGTPTPGTQSFIGIRRTIDLATAKAAAEAFEQNVQKLMGNI